jgi:hypothetical protein
MHAEGEQREPDDVRVARGGEDEVRGGLDQQADPDRPVAVTRRMSRSPMTDPRMPPAAIQVNSRP